MAYRHKGFLTKKQRDGVQSFIHQYNSFMDDPSIPEPQKKLCEFGFSSYALLSNLALRADDIAVMNKKLFGSKSRVKTEWNL